MEYDETTDTHRHGCGEVARWVDHPAYDEVYGLACDACGVVDYN